MCKITVWTDKTKTVLIRSIGFILIFYSIAPDIIKWMTFSQIIMFGLGVSWIFYEGERK